MVVFKKKGRNIVICLLNQIQWKLCVYIHRYLILIIAIIMRKLFSVLSVVVCLVIMITNNVVFNGTDTYNSNDGCMHNETYLCHFICNCILCSIKITYKLQCTFVVYREKTIGYSFKVEMYPRFMIICLYSNALNSDLDTLILELENEKKSSTIVIPKQ